MRMCACTEIDPVSLGLRGFASVFVSFGEFGTVFDIVCYLPCLFTTQEPCRGRISFLQRQVRGSKIVPPMSATL